MPSPNSLLLSFPHLFCLFHCYLGIAMGENTLFCSGFKMAYIPPWCQSFFCEKTQPSCSMNSKVKVWKHPGNQSKCRQAIFLNFPNSCIYLCSVSGDIRSGGPSWRQSWLTFVFGWLLPRQSSSVRICPLTADSLRSVSTQHCCLSIQQPIKPSELKLKRKITVFTLWLSEFSI